MDINKKQFRGFLSEVKSTRQIWMETVDQLKHVFAELKETVGASLKDNQAYISKVIQTHNSLNSLLTSFEEEVNSKWVSLKNMLDEYEQSRNSHVQDILKQRRKELNDITQHLTLLRRRLSEFAEKNLNMDNPIDIGAEITKVYSRSEKAWVAVEEGNKKMLELIEEAKRKYNARYENLESGLDVIKEGVDKMKLKALSLESQYKEDRESEAVVTQDLMKLCNDQEADVLQLLKTEDECGESAIDFLQESTKKLKNLIKEEFEDKNIKLEDNEGGNIIAEGNLIMGQSEVQPEEILKSVERLMTTFNEESKSSLKMVELMRLSRTEDISKEGVDDTKIRAKELEEKFRDSLSQMNAAKKILENFEELIKAKLSAVQQEKTGAISSRGITSELKIETQVTPTNLPERKRQSSDEDGLQNIVTSYRKKPKLNIKEEPK